MRSVVGIVTRLEDGWGSDSGGDKEDISLLKNTGALTHVQWAPEFLSGVKADGARILPPTSIQLRN